MPYTAKQERFLGAIAGGAKMRKKTGLSPEKAKEMLRHGKGDQHGAEKAVKRAKEATRKKFGR